MKKRSFIKVMLLMFFSLTSVVASSQDLNSIISGVRDVLTSNQASAENIIGTWVYERPAVSFEGDNILSQAGGELISQKIEKQIEGIVGKVGLSNNSGSFIFDNSGNYSVVIRGITSSGTYTFNESDKTVTMVTRAGVNVTSNVDIAGNSMKLLFKADSLLSLVDTLGSTLSSASSNSSLSILNTLTSQYKGLKVGFELIKQ